jgi:hypothetical protein
MLQIVGSLKIMIETLAKDEAMIDTFIVQASLMIITLCL